MVKKTTQLNAAQRRVEQRKRLPSPHGSRALRARTPPTGEHLLDKHEVVALTGRSFPTLWAWMRSGKFPRSRVVGSGRSSKSVWLSSEIEAWMAKLPVRRLKGDDQEEQRT